MTLPNGIDERELSRQDVSEESSAGGLERAKPVFGRRALLGRGVETAQGQILPQMAYYQSLLFS